jgi:Endonuclease-reverse transcriptase
MSALMTLNINGNSALKVPKAIRLADEFGVSIIALQETHSTVETEKNLKTQFPQWNMFWEHGTTGSRGVGILVKVNSGYSSVSKFLGRDGRLIGLSMTNGGRKMTVYSIYAPADDKAHCEWFDQLILPVSGVTYIGGDLNVDVSKYYKQQVSQSSRTAHRAEALLNWMERWSLTLHSARSQCHTWFRNGSHPSTLDYWLSNQSSDSMKIDFKHFPYSDHKAVIGRINTHTASNSQWKLNVGILGKREVVDQIRAVTENCWNILSSEEDKSPEERWAAVKYSTIAEARTISRNIAKERRNEITQLERKLNEQQQLVLQTVASREAADKIKNELKLLHESAKVGEKIRIKSAQMTSPDPRIIKFFKLKPKTPATITSRSTGQVLSPQETKEEIEAFFIDLYKPIPGCDYTYPCMDRTNFQWPSTSVLPLSESELTKAAKLLSSYKSPGPDGLQPALWTKVPIAHRSAAENVGVVSPN